MPAPMRTGLLPAAPEPVRFVVPAGTQAGSGAPDNVIAGFMLVRPLHESSVSAVWEAERDGRRYALKCVLPGEARPASRRWLQAEYRCGRSLDHPHIARPLAWVEAQDRAAIVFDYLAGGDLAGLAGFPPDTWSRPLLGLLGALRYLHARGLAHRDVKARNVMLDDADSVRLIDLGSCRRIDSPRRTGGTTPGRHRAETGASVTAKDDMVAFAVLVGEMLTGGTGRAVPEGPGPRIQAAAEAVVAADDADVEEKLSRLAHVLELRDD